MIIEIPVSDLNQADKTIKNKWPLYLISRCNKDIVLEAWGCDTKDEVQQKWDELSQKEGIVEVREYRPRTSAVN